MRLLGHLLHLPTTGGPLVSARFDACPDGEHGATVPEVKAFDSYTSNADLIVAAVRLGYLRKEWSTLDPTWGEGTFWKKWRPDLLLGTDLDPSKSWAGVGVDVRHLPQADRFFDAAVFDGPYKFNGTPDAETDERYGVHLPTRWQDRMDLLIEGTRECARVARIMLLVKCQDQVVSGKKRWQTREVTEAAEAAGFGLLDALHFEGGRPQPEGRRQVHARQNYSTLLVFRRGHNWRHRSDGLS